MSSTKGVALVTGAAQGIGRAIALRLARDGFDVALNDIPPKRDQLHGVADDVEKIGRKSLLVPGDVTVEEEVKGMVQETVKILGSLDAMIANAGIISTPTAMLVSTTLDTWERIMAVNARGCFLCYKHAAEQMIKQGRGGRIIGASSLAGISGLPSCAPYCASKWAVRGLTQTAALELGRYGITVNSYAPGVIKTPMSEHLNDPETLAGVDEDSSHWLMSKMTDRPIKIEGEPEDVANLVSYLASKEAHFITGQCIAIDGGITMS